MHRSVWAATVYGLLGRPVRSPYSNPPWVLIPQQYVSVVMWGRCETREGKLIVGPNINSKFHNKSCSMCWNE